MILYNSGKIFIPRHIADLISAGEGQTLDFKFEVSNSKKLAKTLVAFANTDGGILLIGVKDNGKIAGIRSEEEIFMIESAAKIYSKPPIFYEVKDWKIEDKIILEVKIPKSKLIPHFAKNEQGKWIAYVRSKDKTLPANRILIDVWKRRKFQKPVKISYTRKEQFLLDFLNDFGKITFKQFVELAEISSRSARKILVDFILLDLIDINFTEKEVFYSLKE